MKLRNKKTGEVLRVEFLNNWQTDDGTEIGFRDCNSLDVYSYNTLAELNAEWKDYEEPKRHWFMSEFGKVYCIEDIRFDKERLDWLVEIGNYFETREEAQKAVEKLKAWKRLQDKGFRFEGIKQDYTRFFSQQKPMRIGRKYLQFNKSEDEEWMKENWEDLDLLFGGEE